MVGANRLLPGGCMEVFTMAMASSRRNDRGRRPAASGVVMRNESGTHEVEVSRALNQWAVTVTSLADNRAVARAEDFVRLLNRSEPPPGW
jgi:riboflavin synthase